MVSIFNSLLTILLCSVLLLLSSCGVQQSIASSPNNGSGFVFLKKDGLGRLIAIDRNGMVIQLDQELNPRRDFKDLLLGPAKWVDTQNPFKVMAFYKEQQTLVFLDRELGEIERVHLTQIRQENGVASALSVDNNIWIFDTAERALRKVSPRGEILIKGQPLVNQSFNPFLISYMVEHQQHVFLFLDNKTVFVFDPFGKWLTKLESTESSLSWFITKEQFFIHSNQWYEYRVDVQSFNASDVNLPKGGSHYIRDGEHLIWLDENGVINRKSLSIIKE